ncbi:MAG TPA: phage portal protein [Micromonospora sp.]
MGFWRRLYDLSEAASAAPTFAVDADSIDPAVFGLSSYAAPTSPAPRIDRRAAIQVPAVKRSRDLIAGTLGSLPLDLYGPGQVEVASALFEQPEANVARSVTLTRLFEDLLFEPGPDGRSGVAWWKVEALGWHGFPVKVRRLDPRHVNVDQHSRKVYVDGQHVPDEKLIRFDSPNDALLVAGARAIRTCLGLDSAASEGADGVPPVDYFTPADDADPADDDEIREILKEWQDARRARRTGYVPAALKYNVGGWNPEQLQLAEQRQHAVLEIARTAGVDPEDLGVSTTSRTYQNGETRRRDLLDFTLGGYRQAVQDRLSMPDVSPRGYYARINLDAFLRSDTKTRYEAYEIGLRTGAITEPEIRQLEDRPPLTTREETAVNADTTTTLRVVNFDDAGPALRLDAPHTEAATFEVDAEARTIRGLVVPYGVPAKSRGKLWQFSKGTIKFAAVSRVKLWIQHDPTRAVGVATSFEDTDAGLFGTFKVARGEAGDVALSLAEDGVLDGFSIGLAEGGKYTPRDGINHAVEAPAMEVSLTPAPSFDDARVHAVAASQAGTEPETMGLPAPIDFSPVTAAIAQGFEQLRNPQTGRETVAAGDGVVSEALPYRFDGVPGEHSFSADLRAMASGDSEARQRLDEFMDEAFAVTSANVAGLNPVQNRPELYVPQLEFTRPLWGLVSTGTITDKTPFTVPKFASSGGLVGAHTEGIEPTPGSFTATNQTVTPAPVSGKIEINREVWDQGGSPQADAIIWREMVNGYYETLEARIATRLNGLAIAETNLAGAVDTALVNAVQNIFVGLQFVRGGNRYSALALDGNLFPALVNAADTTGRKLLPVLGPTNAQGETNGAFSEVAIGSQRGRAAWALGTGNDKHSYLFVPGSVWAWASAPKRFTFEYQVKSIDMAVWGYEATAVLRDSDVKRIDYTTADV